MRHLSGYLLTTYLPRNMHTYYFFKTKLLAGFLGLMIIFCLTSQQASAAKRIPLTVKENITGAPQLLGIPFPAGELYSSEHVRLLTEDGREIPSQITVVSTWEPLQQSIKWIWVFFFTESSNQYFLEYGEEVVRQPYQGPKVIVENNQRDYGRVQVSTGSLRFTIDRRGSGFLDQVELDTEGKGFDGEDDLIAEADPKRGTFLDILDDAGLDTSRVVITHTVKEKGSGPLHAIIRLEGEYRYSREDNNPSPFVIRIHAYAGKSYLRVLHTLVYTGEPDKHEKPAGEYAAIATQSKSIIDQQKLKDAAGWTEPNDRIASVGISLDYHLQNDKVIKTAYFDGPWHEPGQEKYLQVNIGAADHVSLLQTGPQPLRVPPLETSSDTKKLDGFASSLQISNKKKLNKDRVSGWLSVEDKKWGIGIGIRHFFEEYPKELALQGDSSRFYAYTWSPNTEPLGFPRADGDFDSGLIANFAQGLAKTTEKVLHFYPATTSEADVRDVFAYFLDPPVTHADPDWYAYSEVYGKMVASRPGYAAFERSLDYKFDWLSFNQKWEPWYGMLDYGDAKTLFNKGEWHMWNNNEPATDLMWWLQFMRTGQREYYLQGWASSQHTMDVDNIHWPTFPDYKGDTNDALDYFVSADPNQKQGTPYLGMGRRHADQHYTSLLSAHVWINGWLASYYLAGNHRGLEVAELSGDYYIRRVFGDHGLRGRRLYLSVWNLVELYDATKKQKYKDELDARVALMLELQKDSDQNGSLVIDRYGYAQVYASMGLDKYYKLTRNEKVKAALITHAKWLRDNPPLNHKMESFLSSIHSLLVGYEYCQDKTLFNEALVRAEVLKADPLPLSFERYKNQKDLGEALEKVSHLPEDLESRRGTIWQFTNGLRVFGWTHIYNIPSLIYWMERENTGSSVLQDSIKITEP